MTSEVTTCKVLHRFQDSIKEGGAQSKLIFLEYRSPSLQYTAAVLFPNRNQRLRLEYLLPKNTRRLRGNGDLVSRSNMTAFALSCQTWQKWIRHQCLQRWFGM